jgi:hypothetical protein
MAKHKLYGRHSRKPGKRTARDALVELIDHIAALIDVKSAVTLSMTVLLCYLLLAEVDPPKETLMIFSGAYGATMAYFFNKGER